MDTLVGDFDDWELKTQEVKGTDVWESEEEANPACASGSKSDHESEPGDLTCAICLANIPLEDLAMVKGCDHMYCVNCILQWALHKEEPWCPQCKHPFSYLLTYRTLDGTLQDFPAEESVCLLKRARWFEDHMRSSEKGKALLDESRMADETAWQDWAEEYDLASDDEIEAFYYSSAAGRARVVFGNRRFGEGGFISGGRRQARATNSTPARGKKGGKGRKPAESAALLTPGGPGASTSNGAPSTPAFSTPNANGGRQSAARSSGGATPSRSISVPRAGRSAGKACKNGADSAADTAASMRAWGGGGGHGSMGESLGSGGGCSYGTSPTGCRTIHGSSPSGSSMVYGSSPAGSGRRARRNARRAAQDYADAMTC